MGFTSQLRVIIAALPLAFSIYQLARGIRLMRQGRRYIRVRSIGPFALANWTRTLLRMGVFAGDPDADPEMRRQVILNWIQVAGREIFGRGAGQLIGILPGTAASGVLLIVVLKDTVALSDTGLLVAFMGSFTVLSAGVEFASTILGQALGVMRGYTALVTRGDGQKSSSLAVPNELGDYRSPSWTPLPLIPALVTISLAAATVVVAHGATTSGEEFTAGDMAAVTSVASLCAAASVAIFCAGEIVVRRTATQDPASFSWNAALSSRTDSIYRGLMIGALTSAEVGSLGIYLGLVLLSLGVALGAVPSIAALATVLLGILLTFVAFWARLRVWRMRGHLGGRYAGWRGTQGASIVQQEET